MLSGAAAGGKDWRELLSYPGPNHLAFWPQQLTVICAGAFNLVNPSLFAKASRF
jgi:hypothetical protein